MKMDIDCKAFSRLISDSQDRELDEQDRTRMRLHFVICQACRTVEEQMAFVRRAMREMDKDKSGSA